MNRILLFCALGALWGCRQATAPSGEAITLCYSTSEPSKTDALTAGDAVTVFARIDGTEHYFLEGAKYSVGSDGHSLTYGSTVYYPETKQAINFYAYFGGTWDEGQGTCSVPSDQSTVADLEQADLCWATASTTPVPTAVALPFSHLLARLIVQTNEPTSKIACQVVPSGTLNPATGQFTLNGGKSEVFTTGSELILPVQPLSRLVLTVSGIEYVFEGSINLQSGQTTTLNLTLNPSTKTATLNGSSTTAWTTSETQGNPTEAVSNLLTLHWANYVPQGTTPDKIIMTIGGTDYTINSDITYANKTFVVPFASNQLRYPYTISKIVFATIPMPCNQLLGATIYKSGAQTVGIKDIPNAVLINGVWWATGNLVATGAQGAAGKGGCKIGAPGDGGLYFQFGSLIGYKGGAQANGGTGVGMPQAPLTTNRTFWDGGGYSWESDAMVWPDNLIGTKRAWVNSTGPGIATLSDYYFNYSVAPWDLAGANIRDFAVWIPGPGDAGEGTLASGRYAAQGVGDPCTYYLGGTWRLPTTNEYVALCNNQGGGGWLPWGATVGGSWTATPTYGGNFSSNRLFFPASGYRSHSTGSFYYVTTAGHCWSSSVYTATDGYNLSFYQPNGVVPQSDGSRSYGFPVRCVAAM